MQVYPAYGQMPQRAMPLNAWTLGALVGMLLLITVASSGARRLDQRFIAADERSQLLLQDDQDLMEIITIIIQAGLLE